MRSGSRGHRAPCGLCWSRNLFEQEQLFWRPSAIETSDDGLVLIADSCRHRIQIYSLTAVLASV